MKFNLKLELIRYIVFSVIGLLLFLFFTLVLDAVGYLAYGGWTPQLGSWPIFGGTISVAVYGHKAPIAILIVSFGVLCRMVAGPVNPWFMRVFDAGKS